MKVLGIIIIALFAIGFLGRTVPIGKAKLMVTFSQIQRTVEIERTRFLVPRSLRWKGWPLGDFGFYEDPLMGTNISTSRWLLDAEGQDIDVGAALLTVNGGRGEHGEDVLILFYGGDTHEIPLIDADILGPANDWIAILGIQEEGSELVLATVGKVVLRISDLDDEPKLHSHRFDSLGELTAYARSELRLLPDLGLEAYLCDSRSKPYIAIWEALSAKNC